MTADADAVLPNLRVRAGDVPERVLVVGDPARAERVARLLTEPVEVSRNREYVLYAGTHGDQRIGVISHGVGSAGATVCFEELCRAGARRLVRAGTAGGLQPDVTDGTLVVARAAVRDEGVTPKIVPPGFPAVADHDVVRALSAGADARSARMAEGIVLTSDLFYPYAVLGDDLALWARAGVIAVEMECAALFVVSSMHQVQAGAILTIDGNPLAGSSGDMSDYDPHRAVVDDAVAAMLDIALDAVAAPL
ncbi:MAG: nucleoside phosphorylase [Acidimicrobiia bacterium]